MVKSVAQFLKKNSLEEISCDLFHKVVVTNPGNSCYPIIHTNQPRELYVYLKYEKFKGKYCPGKCVFKCIGVILKGQISGQGLRFRP